MGGVAPRAVGDGPGLVDHTAGDLRAPDVDADGQAPAHSVSPGVLPVGPSDWGSGRRSRCAAARSRSAVAAKATKSEPRSMVSGFTCCTKAMSWHTGHTRQAVGVAPPHV